MNNKSLDFPIPQDFLDIDPVAAHWVAAHPGDNRTYFVPDTDVHNDMTAAMMSEIPGQDDTVTPRDLKASRFWGFCMSYLMQDGNLAVPGGRYGRDTRDCAEFAIIMALVMRYHGGEPISYYQLNSDMGLVVNSSDGVADLLSESQYMMDDIGLESVNLKELLGDEYIPQTKLERLAKWAEVSMGSDEDTVTITFDEDDAERLVSDIMDGKFMDRQGE
jgi:hypothetical protein